MSLNPFDIQYTHRVLYYTVKLQGMSVTEHYYRWLVTEKEGIQLRAESQNNASYILYLVSRLRY